jgi:hypothetical protein
MCVLVYSCFIKNPSTQSWLTTHHFTMGVLQTVMSDLQQI